MIKIYIIIFSTLLIFTLFNKNKINKIIHNFNFILIIILLIILNPPIFLYYFYYSYFRIDSLSFILIILNLWVVNLAILANYNFILIKNKIKFFVIIFTLITFIILYFLSINLFLFYFFFERTIIPIIILIIGWGYQIDRIRARIFMLFYTLFGSLPLLIIIIFIFFKNNSLIINILILINSTYKVNILIFIFTTIAFLIKIPIYLLHIWLPKAHVESPISGSIILAGIILKLGSYGLIRFIFIIKNLIHKFRLNLIILSIWGATLCCLICLNINDMKVIIAYSSIIHIGSLIARILTFFYWRYIGRLIIIFAHGLCSPALFYLLNLNYKRNNSRNLNFNKRIINLIPTLSIWWFLILICNISSPPTLNLIREIILINRLIYFSIKILFINITLIFLRSLYNIFIFYSTQYNKLNLLNFNIKNLNIKELLINSLHWIPLNTIFLNLNIFLYLNSLKFKTLICGIKNILIILNNI